jgi:hypothetical protein
MLGDENNQIQTQSLSSPSISHKLFWYLAVAYAILLTCDSSIWSQLTGPYQQPASAAASRSVLEHDILEVSSVWLYDMESVHVW